VGNGGLARGEGLGELGPEKIFHSQRKGSRAKREVPELEKSIVQERGSHKSGGNYNLKERIFSISSKSGDGREEEYRRRKRKAKELMTIGRVKEGFRMKG